jgi:hypothetical protein
LTGIGAKVRQLLSLLTGVRLGAHRPKQKEKEDPKEQNSLRFHPDKIRSAPLRDLLERLGRKIGSAAG